MGREMGIEIDDILWEISEWIYGRNCIYCNNKLCEEWVKEYFVGECEECTYPLCVKCAEGIELHIEGGKKNEKVIMIIKNYDNKDMEEKIKKGKIKLWCYGCDLVDSDYENESESDNGRYESDNGRCECNVCLIENGGLIENEECVDNKGYYNGCDFKDWDYGDYGDDLN